jgi:hypothetical protein
MSDHSNARYTGPENLEALTDDRMRMWSGFTNAIVAVIIFMIVLLVGMAYFLI